MSTPVHTFNIDNQTQFSSAVALSGIPITSTPPIDGQALVFNAAVNQFQYATISTPVGFVDIASAQTITGVKTIATDLQFSAGAVITQSGNTFTLPTASGALATTPTGGAFVDTTSAQTISGVKTISSDLQFSPSATITQSGNTFTLPTASGALATTPTGGAFVDTTSAQTISGVKTIGTDLQFSAGAAITQSGNTFTLPTASGALATTPTGGAFVDTTSAQTISGVKTIGTDLQFSAGAVITQSGNTFTFPTASGQFEVEPTTTNTPEGMNALAAVTSGTNNTGLGFNALTALTTGSNNTATGSASLAAVTTGSALTATGTNSFAANTTGTTNVADGFNALAAKTTGSANTAVGSAALVANTTGGNNVAVGMFALQSNTTGTDNVAIGTSALAAETTVGG